MAREGRDWDRGNKRKYQDYAPGPSVHHQGYRNRDHGSNGGNNRNQGSHGGNYTNQGSYGENALPPGWLDCPAYGEEIGSIIPSKVPLGESFNQYISGEKYTPKQAIHQQKLLGREIGLVIDLTNTNRNYSISDWTDEGINYVKIRCKGRDSVPDSESIDKFMNEAVVIVVGSGRTNGNTIGRHDSNQTS